MRGRTERTCIICGKPFSAINYLVKKGFGKLCSRICQGTYYKGKFIGSANHFYGKKHSEEARKKISIGHIGILKGVSRPQHVKEKCRLGNLGKKRSLETRARISNAGRGRIVSEETRRRMALSHSGEKTNFWKGGIDKKVYKHYQNIDYRIWRERVFKRDNFTCQDCKIRGGLLHPHHIKSYTYFPELRYEVSNGKTLCKPCHVNFHSKVGYSNRTH